MLSASGLGQYNSFVWDTIKCCNLILSLNLSASISNNDTPHFQELLSTTSKMGMNLFPAKDGIMSI